MRILDLDIETAPNILDEWDLYRPNRASLNQIRESSYTLCWAAKWHDSPKIFFGARWKGNLFGVYDLLHQADVVVTYNGDHFDLPTLNKEFLLSDLPPPAPYRSVDLYKTVKRVFNFPSNKLAYIVKELGIGEKAETGGHQLWVDVRAGDAKAQRKMEKYCKQDTLLLGPLYDRLLPWAPSLPNRNLYGLPGCPACGTVVEIQRRGYSYTQQGQFQRYQCTICGRWFRGTERLDKVSVI